jgi:stearoyl-CoA desaturase (Delta-9 desaturase)
VLWGGWVRVFLSHHVTFSVNSICHTFGRADFETGDRSRNQWLVGLLAFGEGWHNNHHAFPRSAFHGLRWWQIDISAYLIVALERAGLARNVCRVAPAAQAARRARPVPSVQP